MLLGLVHRTGVPARFEEAVAELSLALRLDPSVPGVISPLSEILVQMGRADEATRTLRDHLSARPEDGVALRTLGSLLLVDGGAEGESFLVRALEIDPRDWRAWLELGTSRLRSGTAADAIDPLERARELQPDSSKTRYNLSLAYRRAGRREEADAEMQEYRRLEEARQTRKVERMIRRRLHNAIDLQQERLVADPERAVEEYLNLANLHAKGQTPDEGRSFFETLAQEHPDLAGPLIGAALLEQQEGREEAAWRYFQEALERQPGSPAALEGMTMLVTPDRGADLAAILADLEGQPGAPPRVPLWRGVIAMRQGHLAEADRHLQRALQRAPEDPDVLLYLGILQAQSGRLVQSLATLQKLLHAHPGHGQAWIQLALAEVQLGLPGHAIDHLEQARVAGAEAPFVLNLLARLLARQGERERAVRVLQRSLRLEPDQEEAVRLLETLTSTVSRSASPG